MIKLVKNKGFKWYNSENIWAKGAFFDNQNNFFEKEAILNYFNQIDTFETFESTLKNCNGVFSIVIHKDTEIWCAVDRCVSSPLFYYMADDHWVVTDDSDIIFYKRRTLEFNDHQINAYKCLGHTFGQETLIKGVFQLQCAEALILKKDKKTYQTFYHQFSIKYFNQQPEKVLQQKGVEIFNSVFKRLIESLGNRTAVVPLSGGYDSRLIAAGLKSQGYEKVICFTYGKKHGNEEMELSKVVAEKLGYKWIFVEYDSLLIKNYNITKEFQDYLKQMSHLSSMFYLQEYFAVKYLFDNKLVPENSVFLPGHSGDLIGGSQFIKVFDKGLSYEEIPSHFLKSKCIYGSLQKLDAIRLCALIETEISNTSGYNAASVFEELDIREKISKVIFNSSQIFDFFNYEKRFPLWDLELLQFFLTLPHEYREMKKLYDAILDNHFFSPLGINFSKKLQPSKKEVRIQKVKNKLKKILPLTLKRKILQRSDWKNYYEGTLPLLMEMRKHSFKYDFKGNSYNEILVAYYLYFLRKDS